MLWANSVVSQQNASLDSMNTEQLLSLLELSPAVAPEAAPASTGSGAGGVGLQAMLSSIGELWGADEYEEEYDY